MRMEKQVWGCLILVREKSLRDLKVDWNLIKKTKGKGSLDFTNQGLLRKYFWCYDYLIFLEIWFFLS